MPAGSQGSPIVKAASSVATFLRDSSVFDLSRMLWNVFFCQLFIGALNLISLNLNSENMTDHLSSSPALAGAASKRVKAFFHFSHRKKEKSKRGRIFYLCFFFFFLKDRKGKEGKMFFSSKDRYQQVCPVWLLGAGWFFKTVFFFFLTTELPWNLQWPLSPYLAAQLSEMLVRMKSRRKRRGEGGGHLGEWLLSISPCQWKNCFPQTAGTVLPHSPIVRRSASRRLKVTSHSSRAEEYDAFPQQSRESWVIWGPLFNTFAAGARCSASLSELSVPRARTQIRTITLFLYQTSAQSHFIQNSFLTLLNCLYVVFFFLLFAAITSRNTTQQWRLHTGEVWNVQTWTNSADVASCVTESVSFSLLLQLCFKYVWLYYVGGKTCWCTVLDESMKMHAWNACEGQGGEDLKKPVGHI